MNSTPGFTHSRTLAVLLILLTILAGSYVRVVNLGESSFRADEIQHYHAAASLQDGGEPINPAGEVYTRGIDITRLVAITDRVVSPPETAARLPAAVFGILNLLLIAVVGWIIGGPWVAFWATLLLAIYPEAIWQSRHVRFYTYQLTHGLVALGAGWMAFRAWEEGRESGRLRSAWIWLAVTLAALLLAARVQIVTLSTIAGWGCFLAIAGAVWAVRNRHRPWRGNLPLQVVAIAGAGVVAALLLRPGLLPHVAARITELPPWQAAPASPLAYYYALAGSFPLIVSLSPLIAGVVLLRRPWLGGYLLVWFLVPFILQSLFAFRQERFILTAVPALFLLAAIAASAGSGAIWRALDAARQRSAHPHRFWARALPLIGVGVVALSAIATTPAFNVARKVPDPRSWPDHRREDWRATVPLVEAARAEGAVALGSSDALSASHYWGHVDFRAVGDVFTPGEVAGSAGVRILADPQSISAWFQDYDRVLIALDQTRIAAGRIDSGLLEVLRTEAVDVCEGRCGTLSLFLWDHRGEQDGVGEGGDER